MAGLMDRVKRKEALIDEAPKAERLEEAISLPLSQIKLHPIYGRDSYDDARQQELNESVATWGIQQPLIVRPITDPMTLRLHPEWTHELLAGYRRRHAASVNGLMTVPVVERDVDDLEAAAISLTENLQRHNPPAPTVGRQLLNLRAEMQKALSAWEERAIDKALNGKRPKKLHRSQIEDMIRAVPPPKFAEGILEHAKEVQRNPKIKWIDIGTVLSLPERSIYDYLNAAGMAPEVQEKAEKGEIGYEHVLVLSRVKDHEQQKHLTQTIIAKNLTTRDAKQLVKSHKARSIGNAAVPADPFNPKQPLKSAIDFLAEAARNVKKSDLKPIERSNDRQELKLLIVKAKEAIAFIERALAESTR